MGSSSPFSFPSFFERWQVKQMFTRKLNPNTEWIEDLSGRLAYVLVIVLIRILFAYTPFLSTDQAWTLTNVVHSVVCVTFSSRSLIGK